LDNELIQMIKRAKIGDKEALIELIMTQKTGLLSPCLYIHEEPR